MRSPLVLLVAAAACATLLTGSAPARADASSWMFVGGGDLALKQGTEPFASHGALAFDVGVGTTPDAPMIVGGVFHLTPIFGGGSDLALTVRAATRGFQSGAFGLALDAGGYERFWGQGSRGFAGALTLGAPLGLQLTVHTMLGTNDAVTVGAVAGVDLLRLTVYRQSLLDWWTNPSPAQQTRTAARW